MQIIQNLAAGFFIGAVTVLSLVAILGIWDVLNDDVVEKSFMTLGLLAVVAVVVIVAGRFIDKAPVDPMLPPPGAGGFRALRQMTLGVLVVSATFLALLGILAIWEVITDHHFVYKTLSSLGIIVFCSSIIVMVCLEREQHPLWKKRGGSFGAGSIVFFFLLAWLIMATLW